MMIFAPLTSSVASSSRSAFSIPPSSMTLRNRNKGKGPVPDSNLSSLLTNDTKSMTGNTVAGDEQKDETSACSAGDQSSAEDGGQTSSPNSTHNDALPKKKLPRVILRLGKPPDP